MNIEVQVFKPSFETPRTPPRPLSPNQKSPTKEQRQVKSNQQQKRQSSLNQYYKKCLRYHIADPLLSRLETLYPKNAVIDRLRSKYAFEDKIFSGGGSGQGGQGHPEENRTERYASP